MFYLFAEKFNEICINSLVRGLKLDLIDKLKKVVIKELYSNWKFKPYSYIFLSHF